MRKFLKIFAIILCIFITLTAFGYYFWYKPNAGPIKKMFVFRKETSNKAAHTALKKLQLNALPLKVFIRKNQYNANFCFLVDMSIPSGKKRFFVYNLKKDSVEIAGLVTHGSGSIIGVEELYFSNVPGSNCTSLGKYKIGNAYQGRFGLAYKLHGLDKTNNKAFERFVVLHGHGCVPDEDIYPLPICPSLGCPTVSPEFLLKLKQYIKDADKPLLLCIYQ